MLILLLLIFNDIYIYFFYFQKLRVFGRWNGYGSCGEIKGRPLFQVKRNCDIFSRENVICNFGSCDENNVGINCYKIQQFDRNSSYKVTNSTGQVVAEVSMFLSNNFLYYRYICNDKINLRDENYVKLRKKSSCVIQHDFGTTK